MRLQPRTRRHQPACFSGSISSRNGRQHRCAPRANDQRMNDTSHTPLSAPHLSAQVPYTKANMVVRKARTSSMLLATRVATAAAPPLICDVRCGCKKHSSSRCLCSDPDLASARYWTFPRARARPKPTLCKKPCEHVLPPASERSPAPCSRALRVRAAR